MCLVMYDMDNIIVTAGFFISSLALLNFFLILKYSSSTRLKTPTRGSSQKKSSRDILAFIGNIVVTKLASWLFFSVILGGIPFAFIYIFTLMKGKSINLEILFGHGELCLISTTLCAIAVGEFLSIAVTRQISTPKIKIFIYAVVACCVAIIALASSTYGMILVSEGNLKINAIVSTSIWLFGFSVFMSSLSIIMSSFIPEITKT